MITVTTIRIGVRLTAYENEDAEGKAYQTALITNASDGGQYNYVFQIYKVWPNGRTYLETTKPGSLEYCLAEYDIWLTRAT